MTEEDKKPGFLGPKWREGMNALIDVLESKENQEKAPEAVSPWRVLPKASLPHWVELIENVENPYFAASIRKDGCIELKKAYNMPLQLDSQEKIVTIDADIDQFHICDLAEVIEKLQGLQEFAKKHFGEGWGK